MVDLSGDPILPGQPGWFVPETERLTLCAAAAVGREAIVFAAQLEGDEHSLDDYYSRFYRYDRGRWVCSVIADKIVGLATMPRHPGELFVLMQDGLSWRVADVAHEERVKRDDDESFLSGLVPIADTLYAVGMDGQCYRREGPGWSRFDQGLAGTVVDAEDPFGGAASIVDVAETASGVHYACGTVAIFKPALFVRRPGEGAWRHLSIDIDHLGLDHCSLSAMLPVDEHDVLVATDVGVLLRGNEADGFRIASEVAREESGSECALQSLASYGGRVYAGGDNGVFVLEPSGGWQAMMGPPDEPFHPGDDRQKIIRGVWLRVADDVLWAFGYTAISWFDGRQWHPLKVPKLFDT